MIIKILKDEYLFSNEGTHICDENGIAIKASEDTDCDIAEVHHQRVYDLVVSNRAFRGLDENGNLILPPVTEEIITPPSEG
jgi:hypothetical protein